MYFTHYYRDYFNCYTDWYGIHVEHLCNFYFLPGQFSNYIEKRQKKVLKWCVISTTEQEKCEDFARAIKESKQFEMDLGCVLKENKHDCMKAIDSDEANVVTLDAGAVYVAGRYYSLAPIMSERYTSGELLILFSQCLKIFMCLSFKCFQPEK